MESEAKAECGCPPGGEENKTAKHLTPEQSERPPRRLLKAGNDNSRLSSVLPHPQIPTNPIAHSVSLKREGLRESPRGHRVLPTAGGCKGPKGLSSVCEKHRQERGWGSRRDALEAQRPVQSDLGKRTVCQPGCSSLKGEPLGGYQ